VTAFRNRTVLAIFAHPDDESLACGGTLARLADAGAHTWVMCASHGEHAAAARAAELRAAARSLGVAGVIQLDFPDGTLRWANVTELQAQILLAVRRLAPIAIVTFGEDGLYWHPDHIGVHEQTVAAVGPFGDQGPALYFVTLPPGAMEGLVSAAAGRRGGEAAGLWGIAPGAFGADAQPATFFVDVRNWTERKLNAIRCHRTQIGPGHALMQVDVEDVRQWLGFEYFRCSPLGRRGVLERIGNPATSSEAAGSHAP
jgi:N-acetyl-1-D-myo-inositol-2-amino-2-deoxy-alpha-D-glucopyranoside deacetylase